MGHTKIKFSGTSVTPEDVLNSIYTEKFTKMGHKIMVCHLTLINGHELVGYSGVVDPSKFDIKIGQEIARRKAIDQVWAHLGSILQNQLAE